MPSRYVLPCRIVVSHRMSAGFLQPVRGDGGVRGVRGGFRVRGKHYHPGRMSRVPLLSSGICCGHSVPSRHPWLKGERDRQPCGKLNNIINDTSSYYGVLVHVCALSRSLFLYLVEDLFLLVTRCRMRRRSKFALEQTGAIPMVVHLCVHRGDGRGDIPLLRYKQKSDQNSCARFACSCVVSYPC